jgi:hypothetical protein
LNANPILAPIAALNIPDTGALSARATQALAFIQNFKVEDDDTFRLAADELQAIKRHANTLEEQRTAITGPINAGLKAVNALFRGPALILEAAEKVLKGKMLAYQREQALLAEKARSLAEEAAAAERRRVAAEAAEHQREAQEQARKAEEARAAGDAQAAALAKAEMQRAMSKANAAETTAQMITAAPVAVAQPKVSGLSTMTLIDFRVTDSLALIRYIADHSDLLYLVKPDDVRLRAYVKATGVLCNLPGVEVFEKQTISQRTAP